jgi:hypothetical protein
MTNLKRIVVITLLAVWTFPALSEAHPTGTTSSPMQAPAPASVPEGTAASRPQLVALADSLSHQTSQPGTEATRLAAREKQAPNLENFRGGAVSIYIGSGAALVLIIVLLLILL